MKKTKKTEIILTLADLLDLIRRAYSEIPNDAHIDFCDSNEEGAVAVTWEEEG